MERFFDALFIGVSYGAIYALVALGIVVVFRGSGHLNFAQGEMATLSAYIAWLATTWTIPLVDWKIPLWLAAIMSMIFGFAIGAAAELLIVRPLAKRSPLAVFVALIAVFLGINAFDAGVWDPPPQELIGSLFPAESKDFVRLFGTTWRWEYIGTLLVALAAAAGLFVLFQKTKIGLAMRAVASNTESGKLVGIPTGWVLAGSWGLAGSLAALAGVMFAGIQGNVNPILMFTIFVYGSAAATLGGLDSPLGAVVAGLTIGIVENQAAEWAPGWIGQEMKLSVALLCIFVVLLVRPSGLFGTARVERV
jgi:branched-chain amino acid transport system permease protein